MKINLYQQDLNFNQKALGNLIIIKGNNLGIEILTPSIWISKL